MFKASPEVFRALREALRSERERFPARDVDIWPEHWHAVLVFLGMTTQWRIAVGAIGMTGRPMYLGLDYAGLRPVLAEHRRVPHAQPIERLMRQLRLLEMAALPELNAA